MFVFTFILYILFMCLPSKLTLLDQLIVLESKLYNFLPQRYNIPSKSLDAYLDSFFFDRFEQIKIRDHIIYPPLRHDGPYRARSRHLNSKIRFYNPTTYTATQNLLL